MIQSSNFNKMIVFNQIILLLIKKQFKKIKNNIVK